MQNIENLQKIRPRIKARQTKKERRQIEIEENLKTLSKYLDDIFRVPGTGWKFGLDSLVGLIPNVGDIFTTIISFYILLAGVRYGVPKITLLRMVFNVGLDYLVGVIPFVGDAFDFVWKANKRNIDLIREHGTGRGKSATDDWLFFIGVIALLVGLLVGSIFFSLFIVWKLLDVFLLTY